MRKEREMKCGDCCYFNFKSGSVDSDGDWKSGTIHGECRINPPIVVAEGDSTVTEFPYVNDGWWCGQFKKLEEAKAFWPKPRLE